MSDEQAMLQLIDERDRANNALQSAHIALGGDGEWVARSGAVVSGESGDLALDVPVMAADLKAESSSLRKELADLHISYADLLKAEPTAPATCQASFTCPDCEGHHFGTVSETGKCVTVYCHDQNNQGCRWSGPYAEHVHND